MRVQEEASKGMCHWHQYPTHLLCLPQAVGAHHELEQLRPGEYVALLRLLNEYVGGVDGRMNACSSLYMPTYGSAHTLALMISFSTSLEKAALGTPFLLLSWFSKMEISASGLSSRSS